MPSRRDFLIGTAALAALGRPGILRGDDMMRARQFITEYEATVRPLEIQASLAWWDANVTGKSEAFAAKEEAQNRLDAALGDRDHFATLKAIRDEKPTDPLVARQIDVLYRMYLEKQVDPALLRKITAKANAIEQAFNVFRAQVDGQELADSAVRKELKESKDSARRRAVWEASKAVGPRVASDLKELVQLRNESARALGFKNYHVLQLDLNEQSQEEVLKLFDELDTLTRTPFLVAKAEIDAKLAASYGITINELRPWHYQDPFFQEAPALSAADLDAAYAHADIPQLCRDFYAGIGLPVDDVLARSDLYEKPGKSPHAFCTDIDREGDVRVLVNIVPNEYWMGTLLHELGHSVYSSKNIPRSLPYALRCEAHILTTEGVAMMFEKLSKSADWLMAMGVPVSDPKAFNTAGATMTRNHMLIFSRWCQVMFRFETALYDDPNQDLDTLWWDLVGQYQGMRRPEAYHRSHYASKIHIVSAPCYYHNYMMGQLFASQVHHAIARDVLGGVAPAQANYVGKPAVGAFMKEKVFAPGRTLPWNALTRHATGADLNPEAFAADFRG